MKQIYILFCATILGMISCNNSRYSDDGQNILSYSSERDKQPVFTADDLNVQFKSIDFFGIKLKGTYEDLISRIYELPQLTLIERRDIVMNEQNGVMFFYHIVDFCGVPCGMNVRFRMGTNDTIHIHELKFITSQIDKEVISRFVSELSKQYGKPENPECARYNWWLKEQWICARSLHTDDGGWTVYFCSIPSA